MGAEILCQTPCKYMPELRGLGLHAHRLLRTIYDYSVNAYDVRGAFSRLTDAGICRAITGKPNESKNKGQGQQIFIQEDHQRRLRRDFPGRSHGGDSPMSMALDRGNET